MYLIRTVVPTGAISKGVETEDLHEAQKWFKSFVRQLSDQRWTGTVQAIEFDKDVEQELERQGMVEGELVD